MSSPPSWRSLLVFVVGLLTGAACQRPDSILLIEVASPAEIHPTQFRVTITSGLVSRALAVPDEPTVPMTLPISFSVELDQSRTAPVTVSIEAFDDQASIVGCGSTVQRHIQLGGQTIISVVMDPFCGAGPLLPDGGAEAGAGAGDGGGGGDGGVDLDAAAD